MSSGELPAIQRLGAGVLPIPTFVVHREIGAIPTELSVQVYDDRVMVLLSQLGNKTQASLPASIPLTLPSTRSGSDEAEDASTKLLSMLPTPSPSISLLPLIGAPLQQTRHDFYVSQIATVIWWLLEATASSGARSNTKARRPVVVGLALKHDRRTAADDDDDDQDDLDDMKANDRQGFAEIISMIAEWPGQ